VTRWFAVALFVLAALLPAVLTRDLLAAVYFTFLLMILAVNYDLLGGFLGYVNLGQGAFFGLAAYTVILILNSGWLNALGAADTLIAAALAILVTLVVSYGFAFPLFRLSGAYFAMGTFAMVLLIRYLILNFSDLTGGSYGVYINPRHYLSLHVAYYLSLVLLVLSLGLNLWLARSRLGLAVNAIRESEVAAASIGIDRFRVKRQTLLLSALPSAAAGAVFALQAGYIDIDSAMGVDKTLLPVVMAMLGGSGLPAGPLVGGAIVRGIDIFLKNYLHLAFPALAVYGIILMIIGLLMPDGVLTFFTKRREAVGVAASVGPAAS